jgi:hypothetical protein
VLGKIYLLDYVPRIHWWNIKLRVLSLLRFKGKKVRARSLLMLEPS